MKQRSANSARVSRRLKASECQNCIHGPTRLTLFNSSGGPSTRMSIKMRSCPFGVQVVAAVIPLRCVQGRPCHLLAWPLSRSGTGTLVTPQLADRSYLWMTYEDLELLSVITIITSNWRGRGRAESFDRLGCLCNRAGTLLPAPAEQEG